MLFRSETLTGVRLKQEMVSKEGWTDEVPLGVSLVAPSSTRTRETSVELRTSWSILSHRTAGPHQLYMLGRRWQRESLLGLVAITNFSSILLRESLCSL